MSYRYFTEDELRRLLLAVPKVSRRKGTAKRNHLMVLMEFTHCLRISEVISLTGANVQDGHVDVRRLKGSERTRHPFISDPDPLFDEATLLRAYLEENKIGLKDRLFPMTRFGALKLIQRAGKKADPPIPVYKLTTHSLKHTRNQQLAKKLAEGKYSLELLQKFNGHVNLSSTGRYLRKTDEEACEAVIDVLGK